MSCLSPDPVRSTLDLPFEAATDRIAALHVERQRARVFDRPSDVLDVERTGPVLRWRARIGRGLIALGSAIAPKPSRAGSRARGGSAISR